MKEIGIGLLGFGTVGTGVIRLLQQNSDIIAHRLDAKPVIRRIADIDIKRDRGVKIDPKLLTKDAMSVIEDPSVEIIVELIGGTTVSKKFILRAIELGKPIVTANKALLATHGKEIFSLARQKNVDIYFSASVGGGIPVIRALREGLIANRIDSIHGILNGTCNYILSRMEDYAMSFEDALKEAQKKGYAEANPALDIKGHDAAHKTAILASIAFGFYVPLEQVHVEGIENISSYDIRYANDLGYKVKLLSVIKNTASGIEARVHPALVHDSSMLASVKGVFNAVCISGDFCKDIMLYGRGAGQDPTASTVVGDISDLVRNMIAGCSHRVPAIPEIRAIYKIRKMEDICTRYYIRMTLLDESGVAARYTKVLGKYKISIAGVWQKEGRYGNYVHVVIITHESREREMAKAVAEIDALDVVGAKTAVFRIDE